MNYSEFYKTSKTRLTEALVSMWASGHLKEQECLRELLEEKEPLIAEPVFQTIFPFLHAAQNSAHSDHLSHKFCKFLDGNLLAGTSIDGLIAAIVVHQEDT